MNRRKDMLGNLRSKVNQMASTLNMPNFANRDSLLGPEIKPADAMTRTVGLDNNGVVGLQRQIMRGNYFNCSKLSFSYYITFALFLVLSMHYFNSYL